MKSIQGGQNVYYSNNMGYTCPIFTSNNMNISSTKVAATEKGFSKYNEGSFPYHTTTNNPQNIRNI